jgi:hypothetical protein
MTSKKMNPATLAACRARNVFSGLAALNNSEDNAPNLETQDRRTVWLARRFNLSLSTAAAVAALHFGEVRA